METRPAGSLADVLEMATRRRRTVTVYAPSLPSSLPEQFGTSHVEVRHVPLESARPFVVLSESEETLSVVHLEDLVSFADGSEDAADDREGRRREFLSALADTTFSSLDRRQLLATSREFEDRAYRVGGGSLHAGFQSLSNFRDQERAYRRLGESGLDVHVYGLPDWTPPHIRNVTVHPERDTEIARTWFVAFDAPRDDAKCALLAEERGDTFHGVWTYDPDLVDCLTEYLQRVYS